MESPRTLKQTVERAQNEVRTLLAEARSNKPDRAKLETGLEEVQNDLKVMDIHLDKPDRAKLETGLKEVPNESKVMDIHLDRPDSK